MTWTWVRSPAARITGMVLAVVCLGLVGVMIVVDAVLLTMRLPATAAGRAWRMFGVTSASTALAFGASGVLVLFVIDGARPAILAGAVVYGMLLVIPGALVGALVGSVLWLDVYRREMETR
jgi:hypothetical protein